MFLHRNIKNIIKIKNYIKIIWFLWEFLKVIFIMKSKFISNKEKGNINNLEV